MGTLKATTLQHESASSGIEMDASGNATLTGNISAADVTASGDLTVDTDTLKVDATNDRVGVNNASPAKTLDVTGDAAVSGDLAVDTDTLKVDTTNDRVGVNKASPTVALDVTGAITASGTITGNAFSGDGSSLTGIESAGLFKFTPDLSFSLTDTTLSMSVGTSSALESTTLTNSSGSTRMYVGYVQFTATTSGYGVRGDYEFVLNGGTVFQGYPNLSPTPSETMTPFDILRVAYGASSSSQGLFAGGGWAGLRARFAQSNVGTSLTVGKADNTTGGNSDVYYIPVFLILADTGTATWKWGQNFGGLSSPSLKYRYVDLD